MDRNELISFIIQERVACFYKNRADKRQEEIQEEQKQLDVWEESLKDLKPETLEKCQSYIDWLLEQQGKELEGCYQFGLEDGIRLMKKIKEIAEP